MEKEKLDELKIQWQQLLSKAQEFIQEIPPGQLYTAIGIVLFTAFLFTVIYRLKHRSANTILFTGLSGSGITVLFYHLRDGFSHRDSVTSMKPNEGRFLLHSEANKLVAKLDEFLSQAAGWILWSFYHIFVLLLSMYLYDILTNASVVKGKTPLLLLCNKMSTDFIRRQLEKEMFITNLLYFVFTSATNFVLQGQRCLQQIRVNEYTLGVVGEAFAFSQFHNKVTTAEASALTGDIYHLEQFIRECVKP
ncbi:hypothetical protein SASPL_107626 [Salvia splendens]|uniref:Signal recognition particle receptor subunit beta n=1 Tax=Salvia splendens TaxID=180675 RepID=A0A8X8YD99_SALSN|nr:hypothetical protein SASPL_107626 [Salvia splendens]